MAKRGRFGVFAGCSRYPDCDYIHRTGPPPPPPLPFEVRVPDVRRGASSRRAARAARATSSTAARAIPSCDFTTNLEPLGAVHDADAGAVALKDESGMCLRCGASVDLPGDRADLPGRTAARRPTKPGRPGAVAQASRRVTWRRPGASGPRAEQRRDAARSAAPSPDTGLMAGQPAPER